MECMIMNNLNSHLTVIDKTSMENWNDNEIFESSKGNIIIIINWKWHLCIILNNLKLYSFVE